MSTNIDERDEMAIAPSETPAELPAAGHDVAPDGSIAGTHTEGGASAPAPAPRRRRGRALVALLAALALAGVYVFRAELGLTTPAEVAGTTASGREILYWVDPMHPAYTSDKPGVAPDCGMDLVPVYADGGPASANLPPGVVQISAEKQQLIGVKVGEVESREVTKTIRAVGKLAYDETKITRIHAKYDGWVERVYADFTGQLVQAGNPLVDIYSPDLYQAQQELLLARRGREELAGSDVAGVSAAGESLYQAARRRLELLDVTAEQIADVEKRGTATRTLTVYAPSTGFVTARSAFLKQRVTSETELYATADLSTVWVVADVYEYESAQVTVGQAATVRLTAFPGRTFRGKVTYIYPDVNAETRTLRVRIDVANPRYELKPDMYADVEIGVSFGRQLLVPEEAVMSTGLKNTVFVALDDGYFEPREVALGEKADGKYVVLSGLSAGERVVTSGNFLIDSESRLKASLSGKGAAVAEDHSKHGTQ